MRKLLNQVKSRLKGFVEQRDDVAMVLATPPADSLPLLTMLEGIEAERASDFFWTFTDAFTGAAPYAQAVVKAFSVKHGAVRMAMQKAGMSPWPPIPAVVEAAATSPATRLRELASFSRELLPVPNGGTVVWTFFPLEIADAVGYAKLMAEVLAHDFPFPWCHHLRFIVRDEPPLRAVGRLLERAPRIQSYAPDLGAEALNKSLEDEVADDTLPLAERMSALLVSAGNDLAFQRFPTALEKYALLLQYHGSMNNHAMTALTLKSMGLVHERMGDEAEAEEAYQAALIPASLGPNPPIPVLQDVILSLAQLRLAQKRWEEAEGYWDSTQKLATISRDAPLKVRSLEQRGVCQERQGKLKEAEQSWNSGAVLAAQLEDVGLCGGLLERLWGLYKKQNNQAKVDELREQLKALGRPVRG